MNQPDPEHTRLLLAARDVMLNACARYSHFRVGAALQCSNGTVFTGANIESSSYGATICAERSALAAALSAGHRSFVTIAVVSDAETPILPCGICRQLLHDYAPSIIVVTEGKNGMRRVMPLTELLPDPFEGSALL